MLWPFWLSCSAASARHARLPAGCACPLPQETRSADRGGYGARLQAEADGYAAELKATAEREAAEIAAKAEAAAATAAEARQEAEAEAKAAKDEARRLRADIERREDRLGEREQRLDELTRRAEDRAGAARRPPGRARPARVGPAGRTGARRRADSRGQAKAELVAAIESQAKRDAVRIVRDIEADAQKEGGKRARKIVTLAIQRVASEQTSESVVSVLHLPGDEMKGRIIGREGRNIRAFESVTGRQPDHRRHSRGRAALVFRSCPARGRQA